MSRGDSGSSRGGRLFGGRCAGARRVDAGAAAQSPGDLRKAHTDNKPSHIPIPPELAAVRDEDFPNESIHISSYFLLCSSPTNAGAVPPSTFCVSFFRGPLPRAPRGEDILDLARGLEAGNLPGFDQNQCAFRIIERTGGILHNFLFLKIQQVHCQHVRTSIAHEKQYLPTRRTPLKCPG